MNRLLFGLLFLMVSIISHANTVIQVGDDRRYSINRQVDYLLDASHDLKLSDVQSSNKWQSIDKNSINLGFIKEAAWFHFELQVENSNDYILQIPYPILDYLDLYSFVDDELYLEVKTGDARRFESRDVDHVHFIFPYRLDAGQTLSVYLRVDTAGGVDVPLLFSTKAIFQKDDIDNAMFRGAILGVTFLMLFYNGFIFVSLKDRVYGFYVLNLFSHIVNSNAYEGWAFKILWPDTPGLNDYVFPIFNGLVLATSIIFMFSLLKGLGSASWYRKYFLVLLATVSTFPFLAVLLPYSIIVPIEVLFTLIVYISSLLLGVYLSYKGDRTAMYFTVAVSLFLVGVVSSNLKALGLLPSNLFTQHAYQIGFFVDMVVLSLALAQKIDIAQKERSSAQKENIKNLKRYEDLYRESLSGHFQVGLDGKIVSVNNAFLEILGYENSGQLFESKMVRDINQFSVDDEASRTIINTVKNLGCIIDFEEQVAKKDGDIIWISLSIRSVTNSEGAVEYYEGSMLDINERKENEILKERSMKDKMSTLEQLVIGISHELNTPLGTSITGVSHLNELMNDMKDKKQKNILSMKEFDEILAEEYQTIDLTRSNLDKVGELIKQFKQISVNQYGYEVEEVNLFASISSGLARYKKALTENSITIVVNCEKGINVNTYGEAISEIITQLVSNSIDHAFKALGNRRIEITVNVKANNIELLYQDNGRGLSAKGVEELFNPFYTTMRGSQGKVGLGMYLTFNLLTQLLKGEVVVENPQQGLSILMTFPSHIN